MTGTLIDPKSALSMPILVLSLALSPAPKSFSLAPTDHSALAYLSMAIGAHYGFQRR